MINIDYTDVSMWKRFGLTTAAAAAYWFVVHYVVSSFLYSLPLMFFIPGAMLAGPLWWPYEYGGKPKTGPPAKEDKNKRDYQVIIIGAGPAGLAASACLKDQGISCIAFDRDSSVAGMWSRHYERLHLHTDKGMSHLPFVKYADNIPRYPSRDQVYNYMQGYAATLNLNIRLNSTVTKTARNGNTWEVDVEDKDGDVTKYSSQYLIVATGENIVPIKPTWPGMDGFKGKVVHTLDYLNGSEFKGKKVLVVGCGNSGAEIAVDLWEHGAKTSICVRSGVNIMPRDTFGVSSVRLGWLSGLDRLPYALRAKIEPFLKVDLTDYGIPPEDTCMGENIYENHKSPLMDIGTVPLIKSRDITVYKGIKKFLGDGSTLEFVDGKKASFDAVILATGSRPCFKSFLDNADSLTDSKGYPCYRRGVPVPGQNMYFIGYADNLGRLREMGIESQRVAKAIAKELAEQ
eukprot:TRINITY_DN146_c0_g3_i1.p1 TRINITY_DN146_c0_g3~~TRINITY_DN146_c0_g3_i1.p1  ORF type:complete len:458 (-),score=117.77 TRINITY_DN146_c0_g3_i1:1920-3293(-)